MIDSGIILSEMMRHMAHMHIGSITFKSNDRHQPDPPDNVMISEQSCNKPSFKSF